MWLICLLISVAIPFAVGGIYAATSSGDFARKPKISLFHALFAGVLAASVVMFFPIHFSSVELTFFGGLRALLLSLFNSIQIFAAGCEFGVVGECEALIAESIRGYYQSWASALFFAAPIFTFGFILSLFNNLSAKLRYLFMYGRPVYVFSELNEKALVLANDVKAKDGKSVIIFTDVFEDNDETSFEMMEEAKKLRAICYKNDILAADFRRHSPKSPIFFFTIGANETENLNQALKLIERYKTRENTHLYVFSTNISSDLLMSSVDRGAVKFRRINEVRSLINSLLYENGDIIFRSARPDGTGKKAISAAVVGMGRHGTEMLKALAWFGQMDGYTLEINAFDKDPLAKERFDALAPELTSPEYNGVYVEGEAQYKIKIHPGMDVSTSSFFREIGKLSRASYVFVSLGDDDLNVKTAVELRTCFERMKIKPVIQAVVSNSQQSNALRGIKNFKGQEYLIDFIGDVESSYAADVIIDSELENDALQRHLKWGNEEEFWDYEYNYRSSVASAIHMRARVNCGIPGAGKRTEDLTPAEKEGIETLEHKRWNAYMRAEGYIFSGSTDKSSRNDLGKMHHDLVDFASLTEEEKRKDSDIGAQ